MSKTDVKDVYRKTIVLTEVDICVSGPVRGVRRSLPSSSRPRNISGITEYLGRRYTAVLWLDVALYGGYLLGPLTNGIGS